MSPQPRISKLATDATRRIVQNAVVATGATPLLTETAVVTDDQPHAPVDETAPPLTEAECVASQVWPAAEQEVSAWTGRDASLV